MKRLIVRNLLFILLFMLSMSGILCCSWEASKTGISVPPLSSDTAQILETTTPHNDDNPVLISSTPSPYFDNLSRHINRFQSNEFEVGRYSLVTANIGSSAVTVNTGDGVSHIVLGIRSSSKYNYGFLCNIDRVTSSGSIYMYTIGFDTASKEVAGVFLPSTNTWSKNESDIPVTQEIDFRSILSSYPNYLFKLCIVDISTENQIDVADTLMHVTRYHWTNKFPYLYAISNIVYVPDYYTEHLKQKADSIRINMEKAGDNSFTFAFITDLHWDVNCRLSPALLRRIMNSVPVKYVVCGGDIIGEGTKEYAESTMIDCIDSFRKLGITFPVCIGNHDRNWNPAHNQRDYPERKLSNQEVRTLLETQYSEYPAVYFSNNGLNFYIDYPSNTRLVFLDTGDTHEHDGVSAIYWSDYKAFADVLMASGDRNIIVIAHSLSGNIGTRLCRISTGFNNRNAEYNSSYLSYDFSQATGHVYLVIGGHIHSDTINKPDGCNVAYVTVDTDSMKTHNQDGATPGTIDSQAFDIITVDYNTGIIRFVRIGRGHDREITVID